VSAGLIKNRVVGMELRLRRESEAFKWYEAGMLVTMGEIFEEWHLLTEVSQYHKECIQAGKPLDTPHFELGKTDVGGKTVTILSVHPCLMNNRQALGGLLKVSPEDQLRQVMAEASGPQPWVGLHSTGTNLHV
jgi:hypothetical protein